MVMCDIELEKKENKIQTNENTEPRHLLYSGLAFSLVVCLAVVFQKVHYTIHQKNNCAMFKYIQEFP